MITSPDHEPLKIYPISHTFEKRKYQILLGGNVQEVALLVAKSWEDMPDGKLGQVEYVQVARRLRDSADIEHFVPVKPRVHRLQSAFMDLTSDGREAVSERYVAYWVRPNEIKGLVNE